MNNITDKKNFTGILWQKSADANPLLKRNLQLWLALASDGTVTGVAYRLFSKFWNEQCVLQL
jgi:cation transport regulator ChaC